MSSNPLRFRLVTFFIAIYWVCMHDTSGITRIAVSIIAAISILLLSVILYNSDWKSQPSINAIAVKMQKMNGMVKRVPVAAAARLKKVSRTLSEPVRRWTPKSMPRISRRWTMRSFGSRTALIIEEGEIGLVPRGPDAV